MLKMGSDLSYYWRVFAGGTFLFLLFYTALTGALTFIPMLMLMFAYRLSLARWITDILVGAWLTFAPAVYELLYGVRITVTGDVSKLSKSTCSLVLLNHRTRLDWLFILSLQARYASLRRFKISLKYPLRHIPGAGWAMQVAGFLFLKRTIEEDRFRIEHLLNHFKLWRSGPQFLLFPEGTDFRVDSLENSKRFARKNELPEFDYVLHPRTAGFTLMFNHMRLNNNLDQVVDVTVGYPKNMVQKETDLVTKQLPQEILFHVQVFNISTLPREQEGLNKWIQERWEEKEYMLKRFYEEKCWPQKEKYLNNAQKLDIERDAVLYYICALVYWVSLSVITLYAFVSFSFIRWYYLFSFVFCVILGNYVGIENTIIILDNR